MNYIEFKNKFKDNILITKKEIVLNYPNFDVKNLVYWQKKGYIKKIINNYYIFSDIKIIRYINFFIANNIYFPSYISSFSALSYYNLIPEYVTQIVSISTNTTKSYNTDLGLYKYHNIKKELFWGYDIKIIGDKSFYISDIEKTLLDFFYINKQYKTIYDIESLRLNYDILKEKLDKKKLLKYLDIFDNLTLKKTILTLLKIIENA